MIFHHIKMEVIKTEIEGVVIIEPRLFKDERGYFLNLFPKEILTNRYAPFILYKTMKVNPVTEYCVDCISRNHPLHKASW